MARRSFPPFISFGISPNFVIIVSCFLPVLHNNTANDNQASARPQQPLLEEVIKRSFLLDENIIESCIVTASLRKLKVSKARGTRLTATGVTVAWCRKTEEKKKGEKQYSNYVSACSRLVDFLRLTSGESELPFVLLSTCIDWLAGADSRFEVEEGDVEEASVVWLVVLYEDDDGEDVVVVVAVDEAAAAAAAAMAAWCWPINAAIWRCCCFLCSSNSFIRLL